MLKIRRSCYSVVNNIYAIIQYSIKMHLFDKIDYFSSLCVVLVFAGFQLH